MKQAEIAQLLPGIFQRTLRSGSMLYAILGVMEALHAPSERVLERSDEFFDPYRTPDLFVPYLAGWVDLKWVLTESSDLASGTGRLRGLVASAAFLSQWRGTAKGLLRFLEVVTGQAGFELDEQVLDEAGRPRPFHIRVRAPNSTLPYRALIERIITVEKPAYVTYDLIFQEEE